MQKSRLPSFTKFLFLASILITSLPAPLKADSVAPEHQSRLIDRAALATQDRSISTLTAMLNKHKNTEREPVFLSRLADLYLERSVLSFRISEGSLNASKNKLYLQSLNQAIQALSTLIKKYPHFPEIQYAYFKRGKAFKELKQTQQSKGDYLTLIQQHPSFPMNDSVYMDLAEYASDANQHEEALKYLKEVEKMNYSDYYVLALHKTAWSLFNLSRLQDALTYLEREINFYYQEQEKNKEKDSISGKNADLAFVETAFSDYALFCFEAFNKKMDFIEAPEVVKKLKKLDQFGAYYGTTLLKFSKLLKAYDLVQPLNDLEKYLIKKDPKLPETAEIALVIFQYQFEKHQYQQMTKIIHDLADIKSSQSSPELLQKIEQTLGLALKEIHELILKNKSSTDLAVLLAPLRELTQGMGTLLGEQAAATLAARYALAETSFEIKNYPDATLGYRSLLDPKFKNILLTKNLTLAQMSLRSISSRYQELKNEGMITSSLPIKTLNEKYESTPQSKLQSKSALEWIQWVDEHTKYTTSKDQNSDQLALEGFQLESYRLLYQYFDRTQAITKLNDFAFLHPSSEYAQPALSIVLDTLSHNEQWEELFKLTQRALKQNWKNASFKKQLFEMGSDAHFRITQSLSQSKSLSQEKLSELISRSKECIKLFAGASITEQCQIIHAKAELASKNYSAAEAELSLLIQNIKNSKDQAKKLSPLLLLRSEARKYLGETTLEMKDLEEYQALNQYQDGDITQSLLQHYWFHQNIEALQALFKNKNACKGKNQVQCEHYEIILELTSHKYQKTHHNELFKNATRGPKNNSVLWALMDLQQPKTTPFQDRLILLQKISSNWSETPTLTQVQLVHLLKERVAQTLESIRISAPGIAPLNPDEASIARRMTLTKEVDHTFAQVMKLPWIEIKMKATEELELFYLRLAQDLKSIQTPDDLLKPFVQKAKEIHEAKSMLLAMAKEYRMPAQRSIASVGHSEGTFNIEHWLTQPSLLKSLPSTLQPLWKKSVSEKRSDLLFYLISQAELTQPSLKDQSNVLRGLSLALAGAPTEGFELIQSAPESSLKTEVATYFLPRGVHE